MRLPPLLLAAALALPALAGRPPIPQNRWIPQPEPYRAAEADAYMPVALSLAPGLQTGLATDDVTLLRLGILSADYHNVGVLDLTLGYAHASGAQRGLQLSSVGVVEGPLHGVQLSLLVSVAGLLAEAPSAGAQAALLVNYADGLDGLQFALLCNRSAGGTGVQVAGANFADRLRGLQLGLVNLDGDDIRGAQIGLANAGAKRFSGLQLGAFNGGGDDFSGWQAGLLNAAVRLDGTQIGAVNLATTASGAQIGLYNSARTLKGFQLGLLNHVENAPLPWLPFLRLAF